MKETLLSLLLLICFLGACNDPCDDVNCNNGQCDEGICKCDEGYDGTFCDIELRGVYIGNWIGPAVCDFDMQQVSFAITEADGITEVLLNSPSISGIELLAITLGNILSIPSKQFDLDGTPTTISGNANLNGDGTLDLNIVFNVDGFGDDNCFYTLTKQ